MGVVGESGRGARGAASARAAVLIVDDEPGIRDLLRLELTDAGYDVETAENGVTALDAARRRKFDLAVTDLKMPGMDGIATLKALRAIDPEIEVIVATGYASVATAVTCMKQGAYDYIEKPYDIDELQLIMERALQKSHLQSVVALYEASRALLATLHHADVVSLAVTLARQVLHADAVGLALSAGPPGARMQRLPGDATPSASLAAELVARVAASETSAICVPAADEFLPDVFAREASSALVYGLSGRTGSLGTLMLLRRPGSRGFSPPELQKGAVFAHQVALSLDNARLHEELEQRVVELTTTREQLVQAEKLALAGYLAASVAHEVNNPLMVVRTGLDSLREHEPAIRAMWAAARQAAPYLRDERRRSETDTVVHEIGEIVDAALDGVQRISGLVNGFRQLSRSSHPGPRERTDVNQLVRDCLASLANNEPPGRTTVLALSVEPCVTLVNRDDLRTSLLSLMAFLHGPERQPGEPADGLRIHSEVVDGRPTVIVSDGALHLSADERRRLFDPRVEIDTSSGRTLRLNLALPLAYQLLQRNGAEITLSTEQDHGFAFRVVLPPASGSGAGV